MTNRIAEYLTPEPDPERRPQSAAGDDADLGGKTLPANPNSLSSKPAGTDPEADADAEEQAFQNTFGPVLNMAGERLRALRAATDQSKAPPIDWPLIRLAINDKLPPEQEAYVMELTEKYVVWDEAMAQAIRESNRVELN